MVFMAEGKEKLYMVKKKGKLYGIVVVGLAKSGKDTAANYIRGKYGFRKYVFSDLLKEELAERQMPVSKIGMQKVAKELKGKYGQDVLAKKLLGRIRDAGERRVVLVGARSIEEIEYLRGEFGKLAVVKLAADAGRRFGRRESIDPKTSEEFFSRDKGDMKISTMEKLLAAADVVIENNGALDGLYKKLDEFMVKVYK